ncbi:hypothetical protein F4779DRAFT_617087 [Xylariaceae sp. FL0662B]|nr:hypothetical protein F4779DRAFT_617087 [Xylariaceae sp. FL0662B]
MPREHRCLTGTLDQHPNRGIGSVGAIQATIRSFIAPGMRPPICHDCLLKLDGDACNVYGTDSDDLIMEVLYDTGENKTSNMSTSKMLPSAYTRHPSPYFLGRRALAVRKKCKVLDTSAASYNAILGTTSHNCRYGYRDIVAKVVYNYGHAKVPLEAVWTDIDYMYLRRPTKSFPPLLSAESRTISTFCARAVSCQGHRLAAATAFPDQFSANTSAYQTHEHAKFLTPESDVDIDGVNEPPDFPCNGLDRSAIRFLDISPARRYSLVMQDATSVDAYVPGAIRRNVFYDWHTHTRRAPAGASTWTTGTSDVNFPYERGVLVVHGTFGYTPDMRIERIAFIGLVDALLGNDKVVGEAVDAFFDEARGMHSQRGH